MIRIEESFAEPEAVTITIEGKLDRYSLPTLQEVYVGHLESPEQLRIAIDTRDLNSISIEGKNYFRKIQNTVTFLNLPEFLKLELASNDPAP